MDPCLVSARRRPAPWGLTGLPCLRHLHLCPSFLRESWKPPPAPDRQLSLRLRAARAEGGIWCLPFSPSGVCPECGPGVACRPMVAGSGEVLP